MRMMMWIALGLLLCGFQTEIPPGEGVPQFVSTGNTLKFYGGPTPDAKIVFEAKVVKGGKITADSHLVSTTESTITDFTKRKNKKITAQCYGADVTHLTVDDYYSGGTPVTYEDITVTKVKLLMPRAEGTYFARIDKNLCTLEQADLGQYEALPKYNWWIRVLYHRQEKKYGWLVVGEGIKVAGRKF